MIALNEPESSLHPELLPSLARLIVDATRYSQVWVSTHSETLVEEIHKRSRVEPTQLRLDEGETVIDGRDVWDADEA